MKFLVFAGCIAVAAAAITKAPDAGLPTRGGVTMAPITKAPDATMGPATRGPDATLRPPTDPVATKGPDGPTRGPVATKGPDATMGPGTKGPDATRAPMECTKEAYMALEICAMDVEPQRPESGAECPPCRRGVCTMDLSTLEKCAPNTRPEKNAEGCPSCKRPSCTKMPDEIPECTTGESPMRKADGCMSCRVPVCVFKDIAVCEQGVKPTLDGHRCPSCILPTLLECTVRPNDWPVCLPDEKPLVDTSTGCPTCRVERESEIVCEKDALDIPICEAETKPERGEDACPSCRPDNGHGIEGASCTREQFAKCADAIKAGALPECDSGLQPERDPANCCMTCVAVEPRCTEDSKKRCMEVYDTLPECADRQEAADAWNPRSCCPSCKRPAATTEEKPTDGKCTRDAVKACLARVPDCVAGEEITVSSEHCCPSCKRPERQCTQEDVAKCASSTPACTEGEFAQFVKGECCPTCKKPIERPTCDPPCDADGEVCARKPRAEAPVCMKKMVLKLRVKVKDAARRARLAGLSKEEFGTVLREVVERYCERADNQERCSKVKDVVRNTLKVIRTRQCTKDDEPTAEGEDPTEDIEIETDIADFTPATRLLRRLLEEESTNLLTGALGDADAADGMTGSLAPASLAPASTVAPGGEGDGQTDTGSDISGASTAFPGVIALVASVVFLRL